MTTNSFPVFTCCYAGDFPAPKQAFLCFPVSSPALQSVSSLSDFRCIITAAVCVATERRTAEQPEVAAGRAPLWHLVLANQGEPQEQHRQKKKIKIKKDKWNKNGSVLPPQSWLTPFLSPLCYDCPHPWHLIFVVFLPRVLTFLFLLPFFSSPDILSLLFRAVCPQGSPDQPLCLRTQKSAQKTLGLCSREGSFQNKTYRNDLCTAFYLSWQFSRRHSKWIKTKRDLPTTWI